MWFARPSEAIVDTAGTTIIVDPEKCFQQLISEKLLILLRDWPWLESTIVSSNILALLFLQDKLLESVPKLWIPVKSLKNYWTSLFQNWFSNISARAVGFILFCQSSPIFWIGRVCCSVDGQGLCKLSFRGVLSPNRITRNCGGSSKAMALRMLSVPPSWLLYCAFFLPWPLWGTQRSLIVSQRLKGKGRAVPGAEALLGLNRAKFPVEMELGGALFELNSGFQVTKGAQCETPK